MKKNTIKILIIYHSLLLNESIKKAISHHEDLQVVAETTELEMVSLLAEKHQPDWILLIMEAGTKLPNEIVNVMETSEDIRLLAFPTDGSKIEVFENPKEGKLLQIDVLEQLLEVMKTPSVLLNK